MSETIELPELSGITPSVSRESILDSFNQLHKLAKVQQSKTKTFWYKFYEFLQIQLLNKDNEFEKYVLHNEPNDCALISKYSKTTKIDLSSTDLSINEIYLQTLHIIHPLVNFMKNENNQSIDILKDLKQLPIIVFIHGFGGQMSQFEPLMGLLSQCLEIISLDLPGFGNSKIKFNDNCQLTDISPEERHNISNSIGKMKDLDFSSDNIAKIVVEFITQNIPQGKKIILVGHSMGCNISTRVAKKLPESSVEALIFLSPAKFTDDIEENLKKKKSSPLTKIFKFSWIFKFTSVFDTFRCWDRLEGLYSHSVTRQLGDLSQNSKNTNLYIKLKQFRWNVDIDTSIILKYANTYQPCNLSDLIVAIKRFNDNPFDTRVYEKVLIVTGSKDKVALLKDITKLNDNLSHIFKRKISNLIEIKNAGHALLLSKPEFVSGKILNHIESSFPERLHLSPAWVLKLKADISGDKWGLKNELKWLKLVPLSTNISNGNEISPLLGMKTLREGDENHSPMILENYFYNNHPDLNHEPNFPLPKGNLIAIVDISADIPPYNPQSFEIIKYYKCATVSKVVPDPSSIRRFIQLIDSILKSSTVENPLIAVHCHYGFNRTGFLLCCYLIERLGWSVEQAIEGFRMAKSPGIKHPHFIDALYVRYES